MTSERAEQREQRPLRLLAVNASMTGGGAERQMALLLQHLDRRRFSPTLCVLARVGPLFAEVPSDVPVISLEKRSKFDLPRLIVRLARVIRDSRPDVVFSKVDYTNTVVALASRLARSSVPLVLHETSVQSLALQDMSHAWLRRRLLRWSYNRATRVIVPSPGVGEDLERSIGISDGRLVFIPNMVKIDGVRQAAKEDVSHRFSGSGLPLIVTAGRLHRAKGHADLLAAAQLLSRARPCNLLIVGTGPEEANLQRLTRELGLSDRVEFMGFLANPFALMARADVFVSASHFESFGNVIVEAMAVGVPVVSTRVPAGPEWIIDDGETGVFAAAHDPADLAAKIAFVLEDAERAGQIAARGQVEARKYDVPAVVASYEDFLEEAAGR